MSEGLRPRSSTRTGRQKTPATEGRTGCESGLNTQASGGDKNVGWKKAVGYGRVKTKSARRPIDPWVVNAYFDFKYEMAPNTSKPKILIVKFQTSRIAAVTFLYEEDPAA